MSFHLRDGLCFQRLDDGAVRITWHGDRHPMMNITVPMEQFASAVASVSLTGDTADTWRELLKILGTKGDSDQITGPIL